MQFYRYFLIREPKKDKGESACLFSDPVCKVILGFRMLVVLGSCYFRQVS